MATYVMPQTTADFQAILDAALLVANEGGALTQTLQEVQTIIDSAEESSSKIAPNFINESQCVVPKEGVTLPSYGVNRDYSPGDSLSNGWRLYTNSIATINKDVSGNVEVSNFNDGGEYNIYIDSPISPYVNTATLKKKAVYLDGSGNMVVSPASISVSRVDSDTVRFDIKMATSGNGKVFAISLSQEDGDIELLAEQTVIDNVLGTNYDEVAQNAADIEALQYGDARNYINILSLGFYTSGAYSYPIISGHQTTESDYSSIIVIGGDASDEVENSAEMTSEVIAQPWAKLSSFTANGESAIISRSSSTAFTVSRVGGRGVVQVIGYLKEGVL